MLPSTIQTTSDTLYDHLVQISAGLYKKALTDLPPDVRSAVNRVAEVEVGGARTRLDVMVKSIDVSDRTGIIVCQDTGICVFFVSSAPSSRVNGARLIEALRRGIAVATKEHDLGRASSIRSPGRTARTTPARDPGRPRRVRRRQRRAGDPARAQGLRVREHVVPEDALPCRGHVGGQALRPRQRHRRGPPPCPPTVVGVGIGGTADLARHWRRGRSSGRSASHTPSPRSQPWNGSCSRPSTRPASVPRDSVGRHLVRGPRRVRRDAHLDEPGRREHPVLARRTGQRDDPS